MIFTKINYNLPKKYLIYFLVLSIPLYFGLISLTYAFHNSYLVQDDVRQHIVWMERFTNTALFRNDFIADYYQSTFSPIGYEGIYRLAAHIGIDALVFAKILPVILGTICSLFLFKLCLNIFPSQISALLTVLIFNENIWLDNNLTSATPRAFLYPIFTSFLYFLSQRRFLACMLTIILQGLFYPVFVLLEVGILCIRLLNVQWPKIHLTKCRYNYLWALSGLLIAGLVFIPMVLYFAEYGPTINGSQMKLMPEFYPGGRTEYFTRNWLDFLLSGRSGLGLPSFPYAIWMGILLPFFIIKKLPKTQLVDQHKQKILLQILVPSLLLYTVAHFAIMKLYLPSRYTLYSFVFIFSISAGISIYVFINFVFEYFSTPETIHKGGRMTYVLITIFILYSLIEPLHPSTFLPKQSWIVGTQPKLYKYLVQQPTSVVIASTSLEADNIPAFTLRPVWVGYQFAQPYHLGYYTQFRQRMLNLIQAQYSLDSNKVIQFIQESGVDYWLLDSNAFSKDYFSLANNRWLKQYTAAVEPAIQTLQTGSKPVLSEMSQNCAVVTTETHQLLDTHCIIRSLNDNPGH
jgi:hypothetical protein